MATAERQGPSVEQVLADWREQRIENVRFELPDMHGTSRSKLIPLEHAGHYAEVGLNMYGGTVVLDSRSDVVAGTLYNVEMAYADERLKPDPSTAAIVPWAPATGRTICDAYWDDGRPLGAAPRQVFRRVLERCRELGYEPLIGIEPEFYRLDATTRQPLFEGYHIFNTVRNTWVPAIERIVKEMRRFGITAEEDETKPKLPTTVRGVTRGARGRQRDGRAPGRGVRAALQRDAPLRARPLRRPRPRLGAAGIPRALLKPALPAP